MCPAFVTTAQPLQTKKKSSLPLSSSILLPGIISGFLFSSRQRKGEQRPMCMELTLTHALRRSPWVSRLLGAFPPFLQFRILETRQTSRFSPKGRELVWFYLFASFPTCPTTYCTHTPRQKQKQEEEEGS